ncbi:MAG: hypothetical protein KZQ83_09115 [gamma proteobacterium symbiont of Taylorina sp.]|nr:hypothetical protein [gamma proteobacterium symbiont of Taylorina sp.]
MKSIYKIVLITGLCFILQLNSQANPSGAAVVNGQVQFPRLDATTLNISNSPNAIINWQQLSNKAGETTRFIQQNSNSAVFNHFTLCGIDYASLS